MSDFIKDWSGVASLVIVLLSGADWSGFGAWLVEFVKARFGPDPRIAAMEAEIARLKEASK